MNLSFLHLESHAVFKSNGPNALRQRLRVIIRVLNYLNILLIVIFVELWIAARAPAGKEAGA